MSPDFIREAVLRFAETRPRTPPPWFMRAERARGIMRRAQVLAAWRVHREQTEGLLLHIARRLQP